MTDLNHPDRDCARAWEAMPWVLQDRASRDQGDMLIEHMARCEACRAEFAQQSRLRQALSLPSDVALDPHAGLRKLMERIDASESHAAPVTMRRSGWLVRALAAAVVIQAIGIGALGMRMWSDGTSTTYRTLSSDAAPAPAGAIHVVPAPDLSVADWNALLRAQHLQVVGGPNEAGAYTVTASPDVHSVPADTVQKLRASKGIRMAEPIATP